MKIDTRIEGIVTVLDLDGKLTPGHGDTLLRETVERLLAEGRMQILLNLEKVPYMDSAGISQLVSSYKLVSTAGGTIKLLNPLKRVYDVLQLVKLNSLFEIHHEEAAALASFVER